MKIAIFDTKSYDKEYFDIANKTHNHTIKYFSENLTLKNIDNAKGFEAVSGFVNTTFDKEILKALSERGVKVLLQRSMGYNKIDLAAAAEFGINVFRVPNYSCESVAEHAVALLLAANRNICEASRRTRKWNFNLEGLEGKAICGSTTGVIGSGKIGLCLIKTMRAMGSKVIVYDDYAKKMAGNLANLFDFEYATLDELLAKSDFISIHCPLFPSTIHLINAQAIAKMKKGVVLVNAARGPIVDTTALISGLKSGQIRAAGLDVIEREEGRCFFDLSSKSAQEIKKDSEWNELLTLPNVTVTGHQAFFTTIALKEIAEITLNNADDASKGNFTAALKLVNGKVING